MKPLDCDAIELVDLYDLVLGTDDRRRAPASGQDQVREHVESCSRCRMRVLDVTRIARAATVAFDEGAIPIDAGFEEALRARVDGEDDAARGPEATAAAAKETRPRQATTSRSRARRKTDPAHRLVEVAPTDPTRVREILGGPGRVSKEPIRTGLAGGGLDPSRPAFWIPMAAAVLLLLGGGGWVLYWLQNYQPAQPDRPPVAGQGDEPTPPPAGDPDPVPTPEPDRPRDVARDPGPRIEVPPVVELPDPPGPDPEREPRDPVPPRDPGPDRPIVERDPVRPEPEAGRTLAPVLVHVQGSRGGLGLARGDEVRPFQAGVPLSPEDALVVPDGGLVRLEVVGGGSLALDGGTAIRIAREGDVHRVELARGRVLFEVGAGERPFRIETPHGRVEHVSTRFEVSVGAGATRLVTIEGEAVLAAGGTEVDVPAGMASRASGSSPAPAAPIDAQAATEWIDGLATGRVVEFEDRFATAAKGTGDWSVAGGSARLEKGAIRIEATEAGRGIALSPRFALVEGSTCALSVRLAAGAPATPVDLVVVGRPEGGPDWVVRRRVVAGPEPTEARLRFEVPMSLPPETRFQAGIEVEGAGSSVRAGEVEVARLEFPGGRDVDHDFHRRQPSGWQRVTGSWQIAEGRLQARPAGRQAALLVLPPTTAYLGDYSAAITATGRAGGTLGLAFRIQDVKNQYRLVCAFGDDGRTYRLEAVEDGKVRVLAETTAPENGTRHVHLGVRACERGLEALADGAVVLRIEDGAFRRGAIGVVALDEPARFARILVEDYR